MKGWGTELKWNSDLGPRRGLNYYRLVISLKSFPSLQIRKLFILYDAEEEKAKRKRASRRRGSIKNLIISFTNLIVRSLLSMARHFRIFPKPLNELCLDRREFRECSKSSFNAHLLCVHRSSFSMLMSKNNVMPATPFFLAILLDSSRCAIVTLDSR